ncbi:MAG: DNA modification methylase [Candidatus Diapherotrites archaeon]|nr:DNA modification methylase [Candidatus Diapherotrites archaeon]
MKFEDLVELYEEKKKKHGAGAYRHISELLREAKELHKKDWLKKPTPNKDHEQSWRAFKGKNFEKLIIYIIKDEVESLGLKVVDGNTLERTNSRNLPRELSQVKRNLLVDYGEFGSHLPDVDIVIYNPKTLKVIAVISSKITLRERIAQTGYWKLKLMQDEVTKHVKVFFITPDEDRTLKIRKPAKKGRAIVEVDTDGSYVMSEEEVEESDKVKMFDKFIEDLKRLANGRG